MRLKKKPNKSNKGITLIALVITIVVLLILAAVSIATLTGENGILTRANDAKEDTEEAREDELRKLTQAEASTYLEEHEYTAVNDKKVTIPAQCAVSQVEGENTLDDGLVIIDSKGNEWVWIEVPRTDEVYQTAGIDLDVNNITDEQYTAIYDDLANYTSAYRDNNYSDTFYSIEQAGFKNADAYDTAKNNMLRSVYKNGGFWIGRYEVGDSVVTTNNITRTSSSGISNTPVIKVNQIPYNYVTCSQAQTLSQQLSTGEKTTSLMFGIQWNLILKFIENKKGKTQYELLTDSSSWGNYFNVTFTVDRGLYQMEPNENNKYEIVRKNFKKPSNTDVLLSTGNSERNKVLNIYDLTGNVWEYTLEGKQNNNNCIARGSSFNNYYTVNTVTKYYETTTLYSWNHVGFRVTMF